MSKTSRLNDLQGVSNGLSLMLRSFCKLQSDKCTLYARSFVQKDLETFKLNLESKFSESISKSPTENLELLAKKANTFLNQANTLFKSGAFSQSNLFGSRRNYHTQAALSKYYRLGTSPKYYSTTVDKIVDTPTLKNTKPNINVPKFKHKVFIH